MGKKQKILALLVVVIAFGMRLFMVLSMGDKLTLNSDDMGYVHSARVLLDKGILTYHYEDLPTAYIMPGQPFFLALVFLIFGQGHIGMQAARIVQVLMGVSSIALLIELGRRMKMFYPALIAAFMLAVFPASILLSGLLLTENGFGFFTLLSLVLILKAVKSKKIKDFILSGLTLGLANLFRPTLVTLPLLLAFYLLWRKDFTKKEIVKYTAVLTVALLLVMSPWAIRNYFVFHRFIPLSATTGNPLLYGTYVDMNTVRNDGVDDQINWPQKIHDELTTDQMQKEYAVKRFKNQMREAPVYYLKWYTFGKAKMLWRSSFYWKEIFNIKVDQVVRMQNWMRLFIPLGIILAFIKKKPYLWFILIMLAYYTFVHMVYLPMPRYLLPMLPLGWLFSGMALWSILKVFLKGTLYIVRKIRPQSLYTA